MREISQFAAAVALAAIGLGAGLSPSAAEETVTDVAYVEAASGRVVALARGAPVLLGALDIIGDRTRIDLLANSELRVCHYRTQRLLMVKGPARITISTTGVSTDGGKSVDASAEACVAPAVSKHSGGLLTRGASFNR